MDNSIKVKCKRCGKDTQVKDLVLDHVYKMMVCVNCVKERQKPPKPKEEPKAAQRPAGWDAEDEYLERANKEKDSQTVKVDVLDDEKVRYTCPKCKYQFVYNVVKKNPGICPYCGTPIYRFRA